MTCPAPVFTHHGTIELAVTSREASHRSISEDLTAGTGLVWGTLLCLAVAQGHAEVTGHLLKEPDVDVNLGGPLWRAVLTGRVDLVRMLLAHPNTDVNRGYGVSPLQTATLLGFAEIASELLKHPAVDKSIWIDGEEKTW